MRLYFIIDNIESSRRLLFRCFDSRWNRFTPYTRHKVLYRLHHDFQCDYGVGNAKGVLAFDWPLSRIETGDFLAITILPFKPMQVAAIYTVVHRLTRQDILGLSAEEETQVNIAMKRANNNTKKAGEPSNILASFLIDDGCCDGVGD